MTGAGAAEYTAEYTYINDPVSARKFDVEATVSKVN
jgi:hypothetical protein